MTRSASGWPRAVLPRPTFLLHDPNLETMEVICAGQFEPWRWLSDVWAPVEVAHALALGIFPGHEFVSTVFPVTAGEKWLLFSDGINEGRSASGEEYGTERIRESLSVGGAAKVIARAWQGWLDFVNAENQHDDACLALILTKPEASQELLSVAHECKKGRQFFEEWSLTAGFPDLERGRIVLAVDEAVTNIIRHTYKGEPGKPIILSAEIKDDHLHLRLRDYGPPVDKAKLKGRELEDVKPGGLGLLLLQSIFSTVEHIPLADGNEWHLAKPLP